MMGRSFNGSSQYGQEGGVSVTAAPLTLACWYRVGAVAINSLVALTDTTANDSYFYLGISNAGQTEAHANSSAASTYATETTVVSVGEKHHFGATFESASSRYAWLDGSPSAQDTTSCTPTGIDETTIGAIELAAGFFYYVNGDAWDVAIWNVALTQAEMEMLAAGASPLMIRPGNLVRYWPAYGDTSPEVELMNGSELTLTGSPGSTEDRSLILPSHEIIKPPKKGKIWVNDSPSWDSGAVQQKHPGKSSANIAHNDEAFYNNSASGSQCVSSAFDVQEGQLIVVAVRWESGGISDATTISVSDDIGNTYTVLGYKSPSTGTEDERIAVAYCLSSVGTNAANTVTVDLSASRTYRSVKCSSYSYDGTIELGDTGDGESGSNVSSWTTSPGLNAGAGDLIVGIFGNYNSAPDPLVLPSGYDEILAANGTLLQYIEREIKAQEKSLSPSMTADGTDTYVALTAVFQSADTGWTDTTISVGQVIDISPQIEVVRTIKGNPGSSGSFNTSTFNAVGCDCLIIMVSTWNGHTISSCTRDGQSFTLGEYTQTDGWGNGMSVFYLTNPNQNSTSINVQFTQSRSPFGYIVVGLKNVNQSTPFGTWVDDHESGDIVTHTNSPTGVANGLFIDFNTSYYQKAGLAQSNSYQTHIVNNGFSGAIDRMVISTAPGVDGTRDMTWSWSGGDKWSSSAVCINPTTISGQLYLGIQSADRDTANIRWVPITVSLSAAGDLEITLVDTAGNPLANLSGLSWAWFDDGTVDSLTNPVLSGSGETTDANGLFSVNIGGSGGTALSNGQTGILMIMDSTGYIYALYRVVVQGL